MRRSCEEDERQREVAPLVTKVSVHRARVGHLGRLVEHDDQLVHLVAVELALALAPITLRRRVGVGMRRASGGSRGQVHTPRGKALSKALWSWLGFQREMDFDRTHKAARSPETAGLTTPTSARSRKKTRSGRK